MKKYNIIVLCCLYIIKLNSQNSIELNETSFNHILNTQFANLIGSNSNSNIGNFAEVNISEAKVKYNSNIQFSDGTIWAISANGGITDGTLSLFSKDELNTNIGIGTSFHFLDSNKSLQYKVNNLNRYDNLEIKLNNKYYRDSLSIENNIRNLKLENELEILKSDSLKLDLKITELKKYISDDIFTKMNLLEIAKFDEKISKLKTQILELKNAITVNQNKIDILNYELLLVENSKTLTGFKLNNSAVQLDSLKILQVTNHQELNAKRKEIYEYHALNKRSHLTKLKAKRNRQLKALKTTIADTLINTNGFRINWLSIGFNFNHNAFQKYSSTSPFHSQLSKITFSTYELYAQYSSYNFSVFRNTSYYWNVGAKFGLTSNFESLSKRSIAEQTTIKDSNTTRTVKKDIIAYEGDFINNLNTLKLFGNLYWFLFKNNDAAIHFFPEFQVKESVQNQINLGFGVSLFYKDKSDKKNIVNSELFINLIDIQNNNESKLSLLNRSSIGINFSFPINIK